MIINIHSHYNHHHYYYLYSLARDSAKNWKGMNTLANMTDISFYRVIVQYVPSRWAQLLNWALKIFPFIHHSKSLDSLNRFEIRAVFTVETRNTFDKEGEFWGFVYKDEFSQILLVQGKSTLERSPEFTVKENPNLYFYFYFLYKSLHFQNYYHQTSVHGVFFCL